jgi:DNA-binding CsgD family transcriptional regulator
LVALCWEPRRSGRSFAPLETLDLRYGTVFTPYVTLLARDADCARIDRLLADVAKGRGGALVLSGEAGMGKSALCRYAIEQAAGLTVLSAHGIEAEAELPFAGLLELFRDHLDLLDDLPAPQASALTGAFALSEQSAADRFAVYAGVLSLLAALAEAEPVLVVIDDVQWIDAPSAEGLLFAARRLAVEPVGMLIAGRVDPCWAASSGLAGIALGGIDEAAGRALLAREPRAMSAAVRDRLLEASHGNPLALIEVPRTLDDSQLTGARPLEDPLPVGPTLERALVRRLASLPRATRQALLVAASSDSDDASAVLAGLRVIGLPVDALVPAERAEAIAIGGGRLRFRHPLLRSAVYHGSSAVDRRAVHNALASATDGPRRAWHLASGAVGVDETVAQALEAAAATASARGAHRAAARALERSADLSPDTDETVRRLTEAAGEAQVAGRLAEADELIERALGLTEDPLRRAEAMHLRGRGLAWQGEPARAHTLLVREADRVQSLSPGTAAMMLAEAVLPIGMIGDVPMTLQTARAARTAAAGIGGMHEVFTAIGFAAALLLNGEGREARRLLERQLPALRTADALRAPGDLVATAAHGFVWLEDYSTAADLYDRVVAAGRAASSPTALPYALAGRSELAFRTGRWSNAVADATEAVDLSEEMGQPAVTGWALVCLALIEAAYGQTDSCREHVDRGWRLAEATGAAAVRPFAGAALGLLELGLGHPDAAVAALEPVAEITEANGLRAPHIVHWAPDRVEALVRLGRSDEAAQTLDTLEYQARRADSVWALAAAARCRGLLAGEDDVEQQFGEALDHHQRMPSPFERARTQLCYGERLRRAGQRVHARVPLRAALTTFDRLRAEPWSDRARVELKATGESVPRRDPSARDRLTPHELQVAFLVANGATNREAAASLFVTSKTIEFHLGRIYRKLGIRSRTELALRIRNGDQPRLEAPSR